VVASAIPVVPLLPVVVASLPLASLLLGPIAHARAARSAIFRRPCGVTPPSAR